MDMAGPSIWPMILWWPALWSPKWLMLWDMTDMTHIYIIYIFPTQLADCSSNSVRWLRRNDWSQTRSYHQMPSNGKVCWRATGFWMRTMRRTRKCAPALRHVTEAWMHIVRHCSFWMLSYGQDSGATSPGLWGRFVMLACGMPMSTWATDLAWPEPQCGLQSCRSLCSQLSLGKWWSL